MQEDVNASEKIQSSLNRWFHHPASGVLRVLLALLLVTDGLFGLLVYKKFVFPLSLTWLGYLALVEDELSIWTGRIFWLLILIFLVLVPLVRGKATKLIEPLEFAQRIVDRIRKMLNKRGQAISAATVLLILLLGLVVMWGFAPSLVSPVSGHLVAPTLPGDLRLFVIQGDLVRVLDRNSFRPIQTFSPIKSLQNIAVTKDLKRIFATDFEDGQLHELSIETGQEIRNITVGHSASGIALSADGQKLYVAVQGPIPEGKILVYGIGGAALTQVASIGGLGCPVSLFAAARAPRLFVATQCGGGLDPVYVIDTRSDKIIARIPGFAVGSGIVATPDGKQVIVSTGDSIRILEDYSSSSPKIRIMPMSVGPLAVTYDGDLLFVGTPPGLKSFNLKNEHQCAEVGLEAIPSALAVTMDGAVFAQLPTRLFVTQAGALGCK